MSLVLAGYYIVLFTCTPHICRSILGIDPFEYTKGSVNIQTFNDLVHTCALTPLVISGNSYMVPMSVFVYFSLDVLFNFKTFMKNTNYLVHHVFGCFQIYLVFKHFMDNVQTLGFFIWVQETALMPIALMDIFRMKSIQPPLGLYLLRALWYFCTRVYTYGYFFYNYERIFGGYDPRMMMTFCMPLILHNANVFKLQIKSILRVLR